jgi:hypothetical protein
MIQKKSRARITFAGAQTRHHNKQRGQTSPLMPLRFADGSEPIGLQTCQFIETDTMCGKPGFPYCPEHHAVCYRNVSEGEAA